MIYSNGSITAQCSIERTDHIWTQDSSHTALDICLFFRKLRTLTSIILMSSLKQSLISLINFQNLSFHHFCNLYNALQLPKALNVHCVLILRGPLHYIHLAEEKSKAVDSFAQAHTDNKCKSNH